MENLTLCQLRLRHADTRGTPYQLVKVCKPHDGGAATTSSL